jgi:Transposase DDE domain group 1
MKLYTRSDRTSCHRWEANQFRLFLHMGAYWLLHELRSAAPKRSIWRTATFETIRCTFLKIAVRIPRAQDPHQDGAALNLPERSSLDRARHLNRRLRSMSDAASAALAPQLQPLRVANVPQHPPPSTRLMSCARIANRQLPRIIGARCPGTLMPHPYHRRRCSSKPTDHRGALELLQLLAAYRRIGLPPAGEVALCG